MAKAVQPDSLPRGQEPDKVLKTLIEKNIIDIKN